MGKYIDGLVSVVIPTYRRSDKLSRAINSVLNQSYSNLELLLVNDNEPDDVYTENLLKIIEDYQNDPRFHLVLQEKHINGAVARNYGINNARGEYIAFLDDDDWWENNKLELQVEALEQLPLDWGGVSCRIKRYNNDELIMIQPKYKDGYVYKDVLKLMADYETGTLLLRHEALDAAGYFDPTLSRHQDLQLLINFTHIYKLKQLNDLLHCRDISDNQNRPNVERILLAKKQFFTSISPVLNTLSKREIHIVHSMHNAEIGYVKLLSKDYVGALKDLIPLLLCPEAIVLITKKIIIRLKSRVFVLILNCNML